MKTIVLAATHQRLINEAGREVPLPLVDIAETPHRSKPYLTILLQRLEEIADIDGVIIVTNEAIKPELDLWATTLSGLHIPFRIVSDGTLRPEHRKGPVGDLIFALEEARIADDVLVLGGDNWFTYDLGQFVRAARTRSPAVVVTRISHVSQPGRFGWVELDQAKRIVTFLERPESPPPATYLKASCVYYLAKDDLKWLATFSTEHSTRCSPGTFFAWLVARATVYGMESPTSWYDMGRGPEAAQWSGPDFIRFRDIVRHHVHPSFATWQKEAARKLQWVTSAEDLVDVLHDRDGNVRIVAAMILGHVGGVISEPVRSVVIDGLLGALNDGAQNAITAAEGWEEDEEESFFVSATAAQALVGLGYAADAATVFETARRSGHSVHEQRNVGQ